MERPALDKPRSLCRYCGAMPKRRATSTRTKPPKPLKPPKPYDLLAKYYDRVMLDHPMLFRRVRNSLLKDILPRIESVCDLGCGSGEAGLLFAAQGLEVFAVDLSPRQCASVRRKAREEDVAIKVIKADMRSFRLPHPVDLVTCEFDALNHLPRHADLGKTLKAVARALRPGGWFYFDVNTQLAFERIWSTTSWVDEKEFKVTIHGDFDPNRMRATLNLDWFVPSGKNWRHIQESLEEVCWTPEQIRTALRRAGFTRVKAQDGAPFFQGWDWDQPGCRTFYLTQKANASGQGKR